MAEVVVHGPERYAPHIRPKFREDEPVRTPRGDGVVDDLVGPADDGPGWAVAVRIGEELWVFPEDEVESTAPRADSPPERFDTLQLRLVTELTDSVEAAKAAERIDKKIRAVVGRSVLTIEAERHWAEPYFYELDVIVRPLGDPIDALRKLAAEGGDGWLSCRDDGWRCDLWWNADDDEPGFLVPEVRGAEVTFLPWDSPALRPETERPLISV
jgi:hypothetical protein